MDDLAQLVTPMMVIASVLSLIFAAGAMWNSIARKRHLAALEKAEKQEEKIVFKPLPSHPAVVEAGHGHGHAHHTSPASGTSPGRKTSSHSLFRQVQPSGTVESETNRPGNDPYVWE